MRLIRKGKTPSLGMKHTDATKKLISAAHKGKKFSDERRKQMCIIYQRTKGNRIKIYTNKRNIS